MATSTPTWTIVPTPTRPELIALRAAASASARHEELHGSAAAEDVALEHLTLHARAEPQRCRPRAGRPTLASSQRTPAVPRHVITAAAPAVPAQGQPLEASASSPGREEGAATSKRRSSPHGGQPGSASDAAHPPRDPRHRRRPPGYLCRRHSPRLRSRPEQPSSPPSDKLQRSPRPTTSRRPSRPPSQRRTVTFSRCLRVSQALFRPSQRQNSTTSLLRAQNASRQGIKAYPSISLYEPASHLGDTGIRGPQLSQAERKVPRERGRRRARNDAHAEHGKDTSTQTAKQTHPRRSSAQACVTS